MMGPLTEGERWWWWDGFLCGCATVPAVVAVAWIVAWLV